MPITKTLTIKSTGFRNDAAGVVLLVTLVNPPQTNNGMTLFVAEEPRVIEVPTALATLVDDMKVYAPGNTIEASYGAPVAPAKSVA